ncbi:RDD family protein [Bacillus sp. FJAT-29790]|uniref:RDD family protein n=1 Tax=Bacillus sp. FJAT-29790 TaxID=1895002 RepID=UPI001C21CBD5|nr:RDD family protein [Bacillus sp. FJAT-29790]MBU8878626.1 RDD family protein [Bacillus sp. FJAT-29790]
MQTYENTEIEPAGFGIRLIANLIDFLIIYTPIAIGIYFVTGEFTFDWSDTWTWDILYRIYLVITPLLWSGYVIGKRLCKIKIKRVDGEKLTILNMFLREVVGMYILVAITFGIAAIVSGLMVIFREDKRGIHDLIAGTYVAKNN